jgi:hypothetical protein
LDKSILLFGLLSNTIDLSNEIGYVDEMNPSLSLLDNMLGSLDELFPNSIQINNK